MKTIMREEYMRWVVQSQCAMPGRGCPLFCIPWRPEASATDGRKSGWMRQPKPSERNVLDEDNHERGIGGEPFSVNVPCQDEFLPSLSAFLEGQRQMVGRLDGCDNPGGAEGILSTTTVKREGYWRWVIHSVNVLRQTKYTIPPLSPGTE